MKKINISRKIFGGLICGCMIFCSGCYLLPEEEEVLAPPTVKSSEVSYTTVTAKKKSLEKKIVCSGTVTAVDQYNVSYESQSGVISAFYVRPGDSVKKGDVICDLDTHELDYQIEEQELYLKKAQLQMTIIAQNGGSQAEIDSASVDVQLKQRELDKLNEQKQQSSLKAPVSGIVSAISDIRAGDTISPGQTVATVIDTTSLYIPIQPDDFTKFEIGTKVQIRINEDYYEGEVFMNPKELGEYQQEQSQDHNKKASDSTGIDYQGDTAYIQFNDLPSADMAGQIADVILVLDSVEDAIVISNNLIKNVDGEDVVYVLKDGEKTAVKVEIGLSTGSQSQILSGINEGDELILR